MLDLDPDPGLDPCLDVRVRDRVLLFGQRAVVHRLVLRANGPFVDVTGRGQNLGCKFSGLTPDLAEVIVVDAARPMDAQGCRVQWRGWPETIKCRRNKNTLGTDSARVDRRVASLFWGRGGEVVSQSGFYLQIKFKRISTQIGRMHMVRPVEGTSLA